MTPEQIAAMIADREAGTRGPWRIDATRSKSGTYAKINGKDWFSFAKVVVQMNRCLDETAVGLANARRIARVPDMEATIIAQAAELATLHEALSSRLNLWNRAEIQDGYILLWRDGDIIARLSFDMWNAGLEQFHQEAIVGDVLDAFQARDALKGGAK